jgi:hypothetical protein
MMQVILPRKQVNLHKIQGILRSKQAILVVMQANLRQVTLPRKQEILREIQGILAQGVLRSRQVTLVEMQAILMPPKPPKPRPPPSTISTPP